MKKTTDQILKHFQVQDKNKTLKKLNKFIAEGKDKLHFLVDFDRTLTTGKDKNGDNNTSWSILASHLPPKAHAKQLKLYEKYRPLELSGKMTHEQATKWAHQELSIFVKNGINLIEIEKDFRQKTDIRLYAKELLNFSKNLGIPTVILSAGIKEIIDLWSKTHQVSPALVLANRLIIDHDGRIINWDKNIIHHLNKNEHEHEILIKIKTQRPNTILIGDALEDANMSNGNENVLRIRIFNPREDEKIDRKEFTKKTFERFDLIMESETLEPVLKILEMIG